MSKKETFEDLLKLFEGRLLNGTFDISERLAIVCRCHVVCARTSWASGDECDAGLQLLIIGSIIGDKHLRQLRDMDAEHREAGRAGGKSNAIPDEEKVRRYFEWESQIKQLHDQGYKKSVVLRRLKIPKSTYYRYKKLVEKPRRK